MGDLPLFSPSKAFLQKDSIRFPVMIKQVKNLTRLHEDVGSTPGLTQWVKDPRSGVAVSFRVGHRHGSDPVLLWL